MKMLNIKQRVLTIKDACDYLQVSRPTLYRYMKLGGLAHIKLAGAVRFFEKDIVKFLDSNRVMSGGV